MLAARNSAWWTAGLALGSANMVRHRIAGYRTPRPSDTPPDDEYAEMVVGRWERHTRFENKRVLELGPGATLATGERILAAGASAYTAVDLFPLAAPTDGMEYLVTTFPDLPGVAGPFDVVVSNATLEHVADVPGLFSRLADLTVAAATMVHHVDGKTHMRWVRDRDPLNLLRYPDLVYRLMSFPGVPNRLRASDYTRAAGAAGFAATVEPVNVADPGYLDWFPARGYSRDDLAPLSFALVCAKR